MQLYGLEERKAPVVRWDGWWMSTAEWDSDLGVRVTRQSAVTRRPGRLGTL